MESANNMMKRTTLTYPNELYIEMKDCAKTHNLSISEFQRRASRDLLRRVKQGKVEL